MGPFYTTIEEDVMARGRPGGESLGAGPGQILVVLTQERNGLKAAGSMERETGFEPATSTLARLHSTS